MLAPARLDAATVRDLRLSIELRSSGDRITVGYHTTTFYDAVGFHRYASKLVQSTGHLARVSQGPRCRWEVERT